MNHWHESLLVTDQPGSVAELKDLGGEICAGAVKMLASQSSGGFQLSSSGLGESSLSLSTEQLTEKQLYRMHLHNSPVRHWDSSSFELTEKIKSIKCSCEEQDHLLSSILRHKQKCK